MIQHHLLTNKNHWNKLISKTLEKCLNEMPQEI